MTGPNLRGITFLSVHLSILSQKSASGKPGWFTYIGTVRLRHRRSNLRGMIGGLVCTGIMTGDEFIRKVRQLGRERKVAMRFEPRPFLPTWLRHLRVNVLMRTYFILLIIFTTLSVHARHELDGRNIARGQSLYAQQCAECHGAKLEGQPSWRLPDENGVLPAPPHDETGHTWHHDDRLLFEYTKFGGKEALAIRGISDFSSGMPGFSQALSDDEIWDILAYIRSTWPERIQEFQRHRNPPH